MAEINFFNLNNYVHNLVCIKIIPNEIILKQVLTPDDNISFPIKGKLFHVLQINIMKL